MGCSIVVLRVTQSNKYKIMKRTKTSSADVNVKMDEAQTEALDLGVSSLVVNGDGRVVEVASSDAVKIQALADGIVRATAHVGRLYLELCGYIRTNAVSPKLVSHVLAERGFSRSRVSEINRVANAADDVWNRFAAAAIGFRQVLDLERGNVILALSDELGVGRSDAVEGLGKMLHAEVAAESSASVGGEGLAGGGEEKGVRKLERLAVDVLTIAKQLNMQRRKWSIGNGYMLQLSRASKGARSGRSPMPAEVSGVAGSDGQDEEFGGVEGEDTDCEP